MSFAAIFDMDGISAAESRELNEQKDSLFRSMIALADLVVLFDSDGSAR
jgi:hypothetical protein